MKATLGFLLISSACLPSSAQMNRQYDFKNGYPTEEAAQQALADADYQRAITAYRFWYPSVSVEGIFSGNRSIGIKDNEAIGIAAASPRQAFAKRRELNERFGETARADR